MSSTRPYRHIWKAICEGRRAYHMRPAKRERHLRLPKEGKDLGYAESARLIKLPAIIKPEKIPLLHPVNCRRIVKVPDYMS